MNILTIPDLPADKRPRCPCGEPANRWSRCKTCKQIVASCGGHKKTSEQETADHCK